MINKELYTDCGMWGLWNYDSYKYIDCYEKWEKEYVEDEDIERQIAARSFVPIYVHTDGCRVFSVKVDEGLNEREEKYLHLKSKKYLFLSTGKAYISGIEDIEGRINEAAVITLDLPEGYYAVTVCVIAWDEEPGVFLENGDVSPDALPDFVIIIESGVSPDEEYRASVETFDD